MDLRLLRKLSLKVYHEWSGVLMKDELLCHWIFRFLSNHDKNLYIATFPLLFAPFRWSWVYLRSFFLYSFQVLINGLGHFVSVNVKPKLQMVETFIKVSVIKDILQKWWENSGVVWNWWGVAAWPLWRGCHTHLQLWLLLTAALSLNAGLLPTWNWICTLGMGSPSKKIHPY